MSTRRNRQSKPPEAMIDRVRRPVSTFRIFGLTLASDFAFANRLAQATAAGATPDVTFSCVDEPPQEIGWQAIAPAYASPIQTDGGESPFSIHRMAECDILCFTRVADFYLWTDRIVCHLLDPAHAYLVEIHLLGSVLSFFLERRGIPMLHASAVAVDNRAIAFLSSNHGGKSALAAALMQIGHRLLTDDILPMERIAERWMGWPGYPSMRMWPDEAQHFLGQFETLEIVHPQLDKRRVAIGADGFGSFCADAQPLAAIYIPERRDPSVWGDQVQIEPLRPTAALMALVRNSFIPHSVQTLGWQGRRLALFADLIRQVPVRKLVYPDGFRHLPCVCDAILADLASGQHK